MEGCSRESGRSLLCEAQLLLQGLGHLGGRRAGQAEVDLDGVVDEPLQGGQGTDHDDTGHQTLPHSLETRSLGRELRGCVILLSGKKISRSLIITLY